jgi:hypothetical protein
MNNLSNIFSQDPWTHIGALIAVAIGLFGDRYLGLGLGSTTSLVFILGGLAIFGVKITNGTANTVNNTSIAAAKIVADAVAIAAAQAVKDTATAAAEVVKQTATQTAAAIPAPVTPVP